MNPGLNPGLGVLRFGLWCFKNSSWMYSVELVRKKGEEDVFYRKAKDGIFFCHFCPKNPALERVLWRKFFFGFTSTVSTFSLVSLF
jgi:hypothetical protein